MMSNPQDGDVIVTHEARSPACFTIGRMPASPQFSVATRAEAVRMARTYAQQHLVDIWYSQGDRQRLLETYRMRITTGARTAPAKWPHKDRHHRHRLSPPS